MFIKPFFIYLKRSETFMKIYEFSHASTYSTIVDEFRYNRYMESHRNDENDIWGHLWHSTFFKKQLKEEDDFCLKHNYWSDGWSTCPLDEEYDNIRKKYDPRIQKTESGLPYLNEFTPFPIQNLPKIELEKTEIDKLLKEQLYKWVDNVNIVV